MLVGSPQARHKVLRRTHFAEQAKAIIIRTVPIEGALVPI